MIGQSRPLRIGTRGSPLALAQASMVAAALRAAHDWPEDAVEIVPITTSGDVIQDRPLADIGGKALWTKELDRCLVDGRTDVSVHSMKDVETFRPDLLAIAAMLPREDTHDHLIGAPAIAGLRPGAVIGTSSPRRQAQLLHRRPDLKVVTFRGNVQTRLDKLARGEADATLLAAAGLRRLGMCKVGVPIENMLPAPSQGAVGVEARVDRPEITALVAAIDHSPTHACVIAERRLLEGLGGTCRSPIAALARLSEGMIDLEAEILMPDGSERVEVRASFSRDDGEAPRKMARDLLAQASADLRRLFDGAA